MACHLPAMTAVLQSPPSSQLTLLSASSPEAEGRSGEVGRGEGSIVEGHRKGRRRRRERGEEEQHQLSLFAIFLTLLRRSLVSCTTEREEDSRSMEIGWPTEVRHVAHVTFDRFHGFLGLPSEFQTDVPTRAPSASTTVFGVSTESMQCSYDSRGNSVPTILLLMQRRLYSQGGLQAEGIFRITADNTQEEHVRDQLNHGIVPENIDVHCLAGLIKAWFRELPNGVLDALAPEQVMECQTEEDYVQLMSLLPPAESALLDWAVNLMADVVLEEHHNKMNSHNVATVFAPNMTQMADPLNALMHAVQVMNFLKTLITRVLRERHDAVIDDGSSLSESETSDQNDQHGCLEVSLKTQAPYQMDQIFLSQEPHLENPSDLSKDNRDVKRTSQILPDSLAPRGSGCLVVNPRQDTPKQADFTVCQQKEGINDLERNKAGQSSNLYAKQPPKNTIAQPFSQVPSAAEKAKGILRQISSREERAEAWR